MSLTPRCMPAPATVESSKVPPEWVDTADIWTGLGLAPAYGDQHENR